MLAYFHYVSCGSTPLNLDFTSPNTARLAALNAEQIQYLGNLKKEINVKGNIDIHLEPLPWLLTLQIEFYMLSLRAKHKYETDLYWCHQMFFPNWRPGNGHIQELRGND